MRSRRPSLLSLTRVWRTYDTSGQLTMRRARGRSGLLELQMHLRGVLSEVQPQLPSMMDNILWVYAAL